MKGILEEPWISAIGGDIRERQLGEGQFLFRQGDPVSGIFAVIEGRVRLVRYSRDGIVSVLYVAVSGDTFAEAALFSDVYHCDAVADVPSGIAVIPKEAILRAFAANPDVATAFMARLARQVQALRSRLEIRNIRSATERVLQYLLLLSAPGQRAVVFDRCFKDVAAEVGLTHEAFYRALSTLDTQGKIERNGRVIRILDPA
ncbi:MAG: Crp/Fnr family transcriptional regulator [Rhodospirillaceae bacterium]